MATVKPDRARATARLARVVVFPSWGLALVTCRVRMGCSRPMNWIDVRSVRYASAAGDVGSSRETRYGVSLPRQALTTGIRPSTGSPGATRSKSSLLLTESSRNSRRTATLRPRTRPRVRARTPVRTGWGSTGEVGTTAGVTSWAPPCFSAPSTWSWSSVRLNRA